MLRWLVLWSFPIVAFCAASVWQLVLYGDGDDRKAEVERLRAEILFLQNEQLHTLQEKHHLHIVRKKHADISLVTVEPLSDAALRQTLQLAVAPYYPEAFWIRKRDQVQHTPISPSLKKPEVKRPEPSWTERLGIGIEWIAIFLLSVVGLLLSLYDRYKIKYIRKQQDQMDRRQEKIEEEIKGLEEQS